MTLPNLAALRYRAEKAESLCLGEHTLHQTQDNSEIWLTCDVDGKEIGRLKLDLKVAYDQTDTIRYFVSSTFASHDRETAAAIVIELLDRLEQQDVVRHDPYYDPAG